MDIVSLLADIWPQWKINRELGEGSFGKVYEVVREDVAGKFKAALKVISIPKSNSEVQDVMAEGMDYASASSYFKGMMEDLIKEFTMMERLKGNTNIVTYEDHAVIPHENGIGWDILIRMELLTSLKDYTTNRPLTEQDVIQIGIDMCRALEVCKRYSIIHRDIKPENIFVSELGDFKLGDFGIARTAERTMSGMSIKGTFSYMAPEVYKGNPYNASVDIYSLGIVLYRLMNNNRIPFLPPPPAAITYSDRETAEGRRMSGEILPDTALASPAFNAIIRKATEYDPANRYSDPTTMRQDLERLKFYDDTSEKTTIQMNPNIPASNIIIQQPQTAGSIGSLNTTAQPGNANNTVFLFDNSNSTPQMVDPTYNGPTNRTEFLGGGYEAPKKKSIVPMLVGGIAAFIVVIAVIVGLASNGKKDNTPVASNNQPQSTTSNPGDSSDSECYIYAPDTILDLTDTVEVALIIGDYTYREEAEWVSSDTDIMTVNERGVVSAKSEGSATITGTADGKTASVELTVKNMAAANSDATTKNDGGASLEDTSNGEDTHVEEMEVFCNASTLFVGEDVKLIVDADGMIIEFSPNLIWSIDDESVATITYDGILTAKSVGKVTATCEYGDAKASLTIPVVSEPSGNGLTVETNYDSVSIGYASEEHIEVTFVGDVPDNASVRAYYSSELYPLGISWGTPNGRGMELVLQSFSTSGEGEVTIVVNDSDDITKIYAYKKVKVKLN